MKSGTGSRLSLNDMPSAGKTGTTNDNKDGWFVGYTAYYTIGCLGGLRPGAGAEWPVRVVLPGHDLEPVHGDDSSGAGEKTTE